MQQTKEIFLTVSTLFYHPISNVFWLHFKCKISFVKYNKLVRICFVDCRAIFPQINSDTKTGPIWNDAYNLETGWWMLVGRFSQCVYFGIFSFISTFSYKVCGRPILTVILLAQPQLKKYRGQWYVLLCIDITLSFEKRTDFFLLWVNGSFKALMRWVRANCHDCVS